MSKSQHNPDRNDQALNQNNQMSEDPGDGSRKSAVLGRDGSSPAEEPPEQDAQDQSTVEAFGREGAGIAAQGMSMMDESPRIGMIHQDELPGHESELEPKPEWEPRYPGSGRLAGKVALITGADSGIGRAVAALFAREGADVAILYLCEHDDAARTKAIVEGEGCRAITIAGDIGDKSFCERAVADTVGAFGRLDILVNNAGEQHPDQDITDIDEQQLRRTFQTNIFGMFFMTQAARPHLKKGSAIINCTSVTMYQGEKELLDYSSTKGAITAFTRSLSENLVGDGIRVNAVAPGPIWTPLNPFGGSSPEKLETFGQGTPMGRPGQPNEVAPSFLFLACEDSSYMSGQVLHPNGGTIVGS